MITEVRPSSAGTAVPNQRAAEEAQDRLIRALQNKGAAAITVCLPTRNNANTAPEIVAELAHRLVRDCRLVDEILVVDDASTDDTRALCEAAGATVLCAKDAYPELGTACGRGDLVWRAIGRASGDIIVWVDPARHAFSADAVVALIEPLLLNDDVHLVRGTARRVATGGRETDTADRLIDMIERPVLALLDPQFSSIREPLDGDYAGRRSVLRSLPFEPDAGAELGLLVDVVRTMGPGALVEIDLGALDRPYRSAIDRARQTRQMLRAALVRSGRVTNPTAIPQRPPHDDQTEGR
jgi:glucosyl-3-phosphoglycerate synthase